MFPRLIYVVHLFIATCLSSTACLLPTPPHGDAVGSVFGAEPSNCTGGTLTHVDARFTGAPHMHGLTPRLTLAVVNSDVFSFFLKKFIKHNQDVEINDMRQLPLVFPTPEQETRLAKLTEHAIAAKRHEHAGEHPADELAVAVRAISQELLVSAPTYLRPGAQSLLLLLKPADCLHILERAINWETEKLFGVEGKGPFNEF